MGRGAAGDAGGAVGEDAGSTGFDWLVHAASETYSRAFVENPDGVRQVIVEGTRNVLEFAKAARVKSMVYLSTFEVMLGLKGVRASYPDAKLAAEGRPRRGLHGRERGDVLHDPRNGGDAHCGASGSGFETCRRHGRGGITGLCAAVPDEARQFASPRPRLAAEGRTRRDVRPDDGGNAMKTAFIQNCVIQI